MRKILFRGENKVTREWAQGDLFHHGEQLFIAADNRNAEIIPETVGQFTGLTDKNGKKIFECDIISAHLDDLFPENETRLVVVWHECGFFGLSTKFVECKNDGIWFTDILRETWYYSLENEFVKKFEVIGNVYDNPELLKGD